MEVRKIPVFATEAEEAIWWYDHRNELAEDMANAMREGKTGTGSVARLRTRLADAEATKRTGPKESSQAA